LQTVTTLPEAHAPALSDKEQGIQRISPAAPTNGHDRPFAGSLPAGDTQPKVAQDKTAVLEDRVRDDPRGAMDAWMALIREYRDRSKINDARKTYDRFLAVFPQAVST
jgi:cleavage stimulation factor subunit 3